MHDFVFSAFWLPDEKDFLDKNEYFDKRNAAKSHESCRNIMTAEKTNTAFENVIDIAHISPIQDAKDEKNPDESIDNIDNPSNSYSKSLPRSSPENISDMLQASDDNSPNLQPDAKEIQRTPIADPLAALQLRYRKENNTNHELPFHSIIFDADPKVFKTISFLPKFIDGTKSHNTTLLDSYEFMHSQYPVTCEQLVRVDLILNKRTDMNTKMFVVNTNKRKHLFDPV